MKIPLDLARTLAAVVDAGTFEAAAADLSVTPSAVSQRVKQLEQRLGRVLVVRSKPVRVTEAGAAVVRLARQLALLEHDALAAFGGGDATSARPTTVPLAVNADSLGTWFLPALARITERHPVVFDLHRHDQDFTAELLESGSVMGAVTSQATPVAGCLVRPLGVMRYTAVATPGWVARWCAGGVDVDALAVAPRVDFDRRDDLQAEYLRRLGVDGAEPPRHYVPASNDFATAVKLGLGWGLLPGFQSDAELARGELVPLGGPPVDVPLYWQQWNLGSPLLDAIADGITRDARSALAPAA
ncbi:LysR family transcriptional regulator (chromosome initiation inhibitor) [Agromyces flavus]|uniref:LysR family transcriptional regulator (Chromosome initiation inhibitor) n=1 Tax=Agromyces flavus TaxID=589382 RepID=A0A1H1XEK1_9MICO|nr:LysR family transcriptional regulator ArgP [Agromyces flavus]MCP2366396.1 LysR family transcriptional regulator (chromosome initiation inhibitor) [Agromyces flavus]GGI44592.1 transcriptional regulator ArgP [Agromyces flavus]SDT07694.1 LysR family transcriptional regulator, chromosome initiation inhibitor [Agromyces flavus]